MKTAIITFPGSSCDPDMEYALKRVGVEAGIVSCKQTFIEGFDAVVIPGGAAYGDYLRPGAIAGLSPVMTAVRRFAEGGGPVLGVGNGFHILLEAGLLPGAMLINESLKFICEHLHVRTETDRTPFTRGIAPGRVLKIPVAHKHGAYFADPATLTALEERRQVVFRYCDAKGDVSAAANPDGSARNIAGICNEAGNILGIMPHPERSVEPALGGADGKLIFDSVIAWLKEKSK